MESFFRKCASTSAVRMNGSAHCSGHALEDPAHDVAALTSPVAARALKVAEALHQCTRLPHAGRSPGNRGCRHPDSPAVGGGGGVRWGVHDGGKLQTPDQWIRLLVAPIVDARTYALVKELCERAAPPSGPGAYRRSRAFSPASRCGLCGSSCQLETSGKSLDGT